MTNIVRREYCEIVLKNFLQTSDFELEDYTVKSLAEKVTGMMAEYYSLNILYKIRNKCDNKNFFCKKLVMFHKIQEIMGKEQGAFEKEDYIYNYLIKECKKASKFNISYAADCYLAIKDDIFILEDLSLLDYKILKQNHDLDHCKIALKSIADFHATTIIFEETQRIKTGKQFCLYNENPDIFKDSLYRKNENYLGRKWFKNCMNTLLKIAEVCNLPNIDSNKLKDKIQIWSEKVYETIEPSKNYVNVICHGDLSQTNMLFKYDNEKLVDCKLIDFQALRYCPPAHDVMNYIYINTNSSFRKKHFNELLEYYHKIFHLELEKYCVDKDKHIVLERFHESCEYVLPQVILQTAAYATMIPMDSFSHIKNDQELYKKYVYEDRSLECLTSYKYDGFFREIINNMFVELYEL